MNETVLNLVNAIRSGNAVDTENAFAAAMAEKLSVKIDDMRQSVASGMFEQPEEVVEEEVEFTQEEWDALSEEEQAEYELVSETKVSVASGDPVKKAYLGTGNYMQNMVNKPSKPANPHIPPKHKASSSEDEHGKNKSIEEASKATDAGLQTRMDKNFTKSVATRYDGTRKQEAEGKKAMVKTAKIIKSRGGDAAAAKQKASDKNDYENEM